MSELDTIIQMEQVVVGMVGKRLNIKTRFQELMAGCFNRVSMNNKYIIDV